MRKEQDRLILTQSERIREAQRDQSYARETLRLPQWTCVGDLMTQKFPIFALIRSVTKRFLRPTGDGRPVAPRTPSHTTGSSRTES